ncbi:MAG: hypothetical protein B6D61_12705, partial [Bacteroidetes bacterium 4484_249]
NPSNGLFTVELNSISTRTVNIKILNNLGKTIHEKLNINIENNYLEIIDISDYSEGIYFVYLFSNETKYLQKIIIKK